MAYPDLNSPLPSEENRQPLSVSQLTARIEELLESSFPEVWVTGEISDVARPRSGHCYMTLKDEAAQIRAVIWRATAGNLRFDLEDGLEVMCRGSLDVYPPRGSYQLVIRQIEPKGVGSLELALRQLRAKLAAEGLFDDERKRPLPRFPRRIAVVTSPTGAAIRDFLEVLRRRWRGADVLLVPVRVQGDGASREIAEAIRRVNTLSMNIDCLVVTRGGGSLDDLWSFNEEQVVRAIHDSRIPVVSAVGHEIDVTLADLVADVRALTPSEAAERVVPAAVELAAGLRDKAERLHGGLRTCVATLRARLDSLAERRALRKPSERIHDLQQRLDDTHSRATRAIQHRMRTAEASVEKASSQLESLSPLAVLSRGYCLSRRTEDGHVVHDAADLSVGERLTTRFARGEAVSRVETINPPPATLPEEKRHSPHGQ